MDSISRMVPGVLSNQESGETESFAGNLLEYPAVQPPGSLERTQAVPPVLLFRPPWKCRTVAARSVARTER